MDPDDPNPPSDEKALQKFIKAGDQAGFYVELITKDDFDELIQYDALFIRETTFVNHHTFRFAKKAQSLGMVVIDDPEDGQVVFLFVGTNFALPLQIFFRRRP